VLEVLRPLVKELAVGLDFSEGMLRVAQGTGALVVRADALAPPFVEAFDLVTCFSALGHFLPSQHRTLVRAIRGCLAPGGRFLFATGEMPEMTSPGYWLSRAFNAAMHVRNALWSPPFIMYYLTFLLPEAKALLEEEGFEVRVKEGVFPAPYGRYSLVDARRD
jgi:SAM-dependent methyltransferase